MLKECMKAIRLARGRVGGCCSPIGAEALGGCLVFERRIGRCRRDRGSS